MIFVPGQGHCLPIIDYNRPLSDHPLNRGLLNRWRVLNHWTGGTALHDLVNPKSYGTLTGLTPSTAWTREAFCAGWGGSLKYSGGTARVDVGISPIASGSFTLSWWMKGSNTNQVMISNRQSSSPFTGMYVLINNNHLYIQLNDSSVHVFDSGVRNVRDGAWHQCIITVDRSASLMSFYVDGLVDVFNVNISAVTGSIASTSSLWICSDFGGSGWDGHADDWAIWNRAITREEAIAWYAVARVPFNPTLRYLRMDATVTAAPTGGPFPHYIRRSNALLGGFAA